MKKVNGCLILFFFVLLFSRSIGVFAIQIKGPILIIGAGDEDQIRRTSNYKVHDIYKISDVKIANSKIYVVESSSCQLFTFDLRGNLLGKVGGVGGGKNEFYDPKYIECVDSDIWISDFGNARIQVFPKNGNIKTVKNGYTASPNSLAISGQYILLATTSIGYYKISVLDKSGNYKFSIPFESKIIPKNSVSLFYNGRILAMPGNRILIGFIFYPVIAIVESDLKTIKEIDLSDYYYLHKDKRGFTFPPTGYSAASFSNGPGNSILIAACEKKEMRCSKVIQFSQDFKKIGEWDPGFSIWRMSYYPAKNLLAVVNREGEILIYEIH